MIYNPDNIKIEKREIYNDIWEFIIPHDYYFESCGISYGNRIYGAMKLENYYTIKKKKHEADSNKNSE